MSITLGFSHAGSVTNEFPPRAHLKTERLGYTHHGLSLGNGQVIHYLRKTGVTITSLEEFSLGHAVVTVPHTNARYSPDEAVQRALSRLNEDDYLIFDNNCEHFVNWCITGTSTSPQVETFEKSFGAAAAIAAADRLRKGKTVEAIAIAGFATAAYYLIKQPEVQRTLSDIGDKITDIFNND